MKQSIVLLAVLQLLSIVAAHPFVIIQTKTETQRMLPTPILQPRQGGLLDQWASAINSALGIPDPNASTSTSKNSAKTTPPSPGTASAPATPSAVSTRTVQTLAPPATASATSSSTTFRSGLLPVTSLTASSSTVTSTTSTTSSISTSTSTSTTDSSTSTSTTSTSADTTSTSVPLPSSTLPLVQPTTSPVASSADSNGNNVPKAGIAIAVIMIIIIALVVAWLVFRYNSRCQAWWTAREEQRRQERSYREALDGPNAGSPNLRQEALGGDQSRRRTMLQSFFAPATARLEAGKEIKRKPVNWGAKSPALANSQTDGEKIPITASAAPMGQYDESTSSSLPSAPPAIPPVPPLPQAGGRQIIAELDSTPIVPPAASAVSPMSICRKESLHNLPPISPLSPTRATLPIISETPARQELPELPSNSEARRPGPPPVLMARKGADGVYRLG